MFLFFKKKYLRHFDVRTSSAHEGTNFGLKEHAAAVLPSHKIDVAGKRLNLQSSLKGAQMESESTYVACSRSLWSLSPTANHVTTLAESILAPSASTTVIMFSFNPLQFQTSKISLQKVGSMNSNFRISNY